MAPSPFGRKEYVGEFAGFLNSYRKITYISCRLFITQNHIGDNSCLETGLRTLFSFLIIDY